MSHEKKLDLTAGLFFLLLGLLLIFVLIPQGVDSPPGIKIAALSPLYYPQNIAYALTAMGAMIVVAVFLTKGGDSEAEDDEFPQHPQAMLRAGTAIAALFVLYFIMAYLGFIIGAFVALVFYMFLAGERRLYISIPVAILVPLALFFFFGKVAGIPIPAGPLEEILGQI